MTTEELEAVLGKALADARAADKVIRTPWWAAAIAERDAEVDRLKRVNQELSEALVEARERIRQLTDLWHTWEKKATEAKHTHSVWTEADIRVLEDMISNPIGKWEKPDDPHFSPDGERVITRNEAKQVLAKLYKARMKPAPVQPGQTTTPKPEPCPECQDYGLVSDGKGGPIKQCSRGCYSKGARLAANVLGIPVADAPPLVQPGQLRRFLVEVVPQKDEKHAFHQRSVSLKSFEDDPGELRVSLDYTKCALSVRELPEMPPLEALKQVYIDQSFESPSPMGLRAVLRACGLEVAG